MNKSVSDVDQKCLVCGQECKKRRGLGNHVNKAHKHLEGLMGYVLKHQLNCNINHDRSESFYVFNKH